MKWGVRWIEDFLIRRVDLLITVGEKLRGHFTARGACRSVVVGNWKRLEEFSRSEDQNLQIRHGLGIPDSAMVVVCITQLLKDRKIEELLQALDACPDVYLIIGGRGTLEELVRERAAKNPRVQFVGFVSGADIANCTCAGDVVYYGFDPQNPNAQFSAPNKLFEALAAGRPLITGNFGEIAEVVRNASCGIVLPEYSVESIRNALTAMRDSCLRDAMARNARRFGKVAMNWKKGEEILYTEYSALLPNGLSAPTPCESTSVSFVGEPLTTVETSLEMELRR
jgi:glycosyltransferase involved in cell wall biosynthesis